jgi:hypothetical protein
MRIPARRLPGRKILSRGIAGVEGRIELAAVSRDRRQRFGIARTSGAAASPQGQDAGLAGPVTARTPGKEERGPR